MMETHVVMFIGKFPSAMDKSVVFITACFYDASLSEVILLYTNKKVVLLCDAYDDGLFCL